MLHFRNTTVFSIPQIRTVMHGSLVRCKLHCMQRVLAPTPGCLGFRNIPFQTDEFGMCGNFNPSPLDETGVPHVGGDFPYFAG